MRKKAILWWNSLEELYKDYATRMIISPKRSYRSLTGREIEIIYKWTLK